ncbi:MAG: SdpI family protein [Planctomycetes bacterium]|nr:SdpI family protein [Planctomycetota bacterium]
MKTKTSLIIIAGLIIAGFAVSFYYYPQLPDRMASHWNAKGQVDDTMGKEVGAFMMPAAMAITAAIFLVILRIDPLKKNIEKFKSYYFGFIIAECLLLFGIHCWMLLWNVGIKMSPNVIMPIGIGPLFFFIGYIMKNIKRNWFMGIRTPWTLSNETVWKRTHEVSGKLFMGSGIIATSGMFWPEYSIWLIIVPVLTVAAISIVYSYVVFRQVTETESDGTADEMQVSEGSGDTTWDNIKEGYLYQVEKSLMRVKHPAKKQVLEDVASHLDQKYAELDEDDKTWEGYQQAIIEMGPAEDYAELLDGEAPAATVKKAGTPIFKYLRAFALIVIFAGVACWLGFLKFDRLEDNIDIPFINDPEVVGVWESVDYVDNITDFVPGQKQWRGRDGELFLNKLEFHKNGKVLHVNDNAPNGFWVRWSKGVVLCDNSKTSEKYHIQEIDGEKYMFFEWKSGDYTIRHRKPEYYVLKKTGGTQMPVDAEAFLEDFDEKLAGFDIDNAGLEDVINTFGYPTRCMWGQETFDPPELPIRYIMQYPADFNVFMSECKIVEVRHEGPGSGFAFMGKIKIGMPLEEVLDVFGMPDETVEGKKNQFQDNVLYMDIDGRKGHCYYARTDKQARLWFLNYEVHAIYVTRSDYGEDRPSESSKELKKRKQTVIKKLAANGDASEMDIYIVSFKGIEDFDPKTAKELLDAFNNRHSDGVKTSYFRTKTENGKLTGHICVNTKKDAESLTKRLKQNRKLELISSTSEPISKEDFEKHKATR